MDSQDDIIKKEALRLKKLNEEKKKLAEENEASNVLTEKVTGHLDDVSDRTSEATNAQTAALSTGVHLGKTLGYILNGIPLVATLAMIVTGLYKAIHAGFISKEHGALRVVSGVAALGSLGIGITSLILLPLALPLFIASAVVDSAQRIIGLFSEIPNYFRGTWKKERVAQENNLHHFYNELAANPTVFAEFVQHQENPKNKPSFELNKVLTTYKNLQQAENKLQDRKIQIAKKAESLILSIGIAVGAGLLLTPAAPIGVALIFAAVTYSVLNRVFKFSDKIFTRVFKAKPALPFSTVKANVTARAPDDKVIPRPELSASLTNAHSKQLQHESTVDIASVLTPHRDAMDHKKETAEVLEETHQKYLVEKNTAASSKIINDAPVIATNENKKPLEPEEEEGEGESPPHP